MGQSSLLCEAHLLQPGVSLIRSLMGQSPLPRKAHLFEAGPLWSGVSDTNRPLLRSKMPSRSADREARRALFLTLRRANRVSLC